MGIYHTGQRFERTWHQDLRDPNLIFVPHPGPPTEQLAGINPASGGNISASAENTSASAVNSTTIDIPPSPTIVGPSSLIASPITSETNGTNSTG